MEQLKHECGVAMIRLLKPQSYYREKYGTVTYALDKLYLLMEKQHNRGQEGAGVACVKLDARPGEEYMFRERAMGAGAIAEVFDAIHRQPDSYCADIYMGHLRYSTTGRRGMEYVHPFLRRNNRRAQNLALCGNFNLSNTREVFDHIVAGGSTRAAMPIPSFCWSSWATCLITGPTTCAAFCARPAGCGTAVT